MSERILQTDKVTKRFGGLVALDAVDIHVDSDEILGLIGPNGAGKTTLFNTIAGASYATSGIVNYLGHDVTKTPAFRRCKIGIGRTFQITKPFSSMTVLDNVMVGGLYGTGSKVNSLSTKDQVRCKAEAEEILVFLGMADKKNALAGTLNVPERKRLEICRAMATKPKLLLLDEVVAGLNPSEVLGIVEMIKQINSTGIAILMIEHVMKAVMEVSHRIAVLSFGKKIAEGTPDDISRNEIVIEAYLGKRRAR